jgi:hypothetical protein
LRPGGGETSVGELRVAGVGGFWEGEDAYEGQERGRKGAEWGTRGVLA